MTIRGNETPLSDFMRRSRHRWTRTDLARIAEYVVRGAVVGLIGGLLIHQNVPAISEGGCYYSDDGCGSGGPAPVVWHLVLAVAIAMIAPVLWTGEEERRNRRAFAGGLLAFILFTALALATPQRYGRIPDGPPVWASVVLLAVSFPLLAPVMSVRRRTKAVLAVGIVTTMIVAAHPLSQRWQHASTRAAITGIGTTAYAPVLPGWQVADARVSWASPWTLTVTELPVGTSMAQAQPTPRSTVVTPWSPPGVTLPGAPPPPPAPSAAPTSGPFSPGLTQPGLVVEMTKTFDPCAGYTNCYRVNLPPHPEWGCASSCVADSADPTRQIGHPVGGVGEWWLFLQRGSTTIGLSSATMTLDEVRHAADLLQPADLDALTAVYRS